MYRLKAAADAFLLGSMLASGGCVVVPAEGYYRYGFAPYGEYYVTSDGVSLAYDYGPGAYTVVGLPGLYWWGGHYYRRHGDHWEWSDHHGGPWAYRPANRVPFAARGGWHGGAWHGHQWHGSRLQRPHTGGLHE